MFGLRSGAVSARTTKHRFRRLRRTRSEAGFTLIEVLIAGMMLAILSVPISGLLSTTAAITRLDRQRTSADQLAQTQMENIRALPYFDVGLVGGNPQGNLPATATATLPSIGTVTITTTVRYVGDALPSNPYPTNADYKKVVVTLTNSAGKQLAQNTTYVAPASAPPNAGSTLDQIQRTVVDAVTNLALPGASVNLTGGPDTSPVTNRTDTTDASGTVLFPALDTTANGTPGYTLATTLSGYNVFPDDISPGKASAVASTVGVNSTGTLRMYKATSLTVTVLDKNGNPYTAGATVSVASTRCGISSVTVPSGSSSVTVSTCSYANGKTVPLPPNVSGLTITGTAPFNNDNDYFVTAWSSSSTGYWGATSSSGVLVPSSYPTTLTQSVQVKFGSTQYTGSSATKTINVTVKKSGTADSNARVQLSGGPASIYLYATTNSSGVAAFTVPAASTAATYYASANDMGSIAGTASTSVSTGTTSPIALTVNIS